MQIHSETVVDSEGVVDFLVDPSALASCHGQIGQFCLPVTVRGGDVSLYIPAPKSLVLQAPSAVCFREYHQTCGVALLK